MKIETLLANPGRLVVSGLAILVALVHFNTLIMDVSVSLIIVSVALYILWRPVKATENKK